MASSSLHHEGRDAILSRAKRRVHGLVSPSAPISGYPNHYGPLVSRANAVFTPSSEFSGAAVWWTAAAVGEAVTVPSNGPGN
jgi:hypothetical protein